MRSIYINIKNSIPMRAALTFLKRQKKTTAKLVMKNFEMIKVKTLCLRRKDITGLASSAEPS
jgi:hypothetical protein